MTVGSFSIFRNNSKENVSHLISGNVRISSYLKMPLIEAAETQLQCIILRFILYLVKPKVPISFSASDIGRTAAQVKHNADRNYARDNGIMTVVLISDMIMIERTQ